MDKRKFNKGTKGNKGGRPSKADEQQLIEKLSPLMPAAYKALEAALKEEQSWAVKLAMEYFYGKPTQTVNSSVKVEEVKRPDWFDEE